MQYGLPEAKISRRHLYRLAKQGLLSQPALTRARELAGLLPGRAHWQVFVRNLLLVLGAILLLAGVVFFFAYNWASMGRYVKFALLEGAIVACAAVSWYKGISNLSGQIALMMAAVLVGPLLAVFGQTYQTGADPYELFTGWSLLILGWVAIGRFAPLWMLFLVLLNIGWNLYFDQVLRYTAKESAQFLVTFSINAAALAIWEGLAKCKIAWLQGRWMPRAIACGVLVAISCPTIVRIFCSTWHLERDPLLLWVPLLYIACVLFMLWFYQRGTRDMFMLAITVVSIICVLTSLVGKEMVKTFDGFLFLSLLVIGEAAAAAWWLRYLAKVWGEKHE